MGQQEHRIFVNRRLIYGRSGMNSLLQQELRNLRAELNRQIHQVRMLAKEMDIEAAVLKDQSGNFMLTPLLAAKAQVLSALANLEKK